MNAAAHARTEQDAIEEQASLWLAKQRLLAANEFEADQFEAWLAADARHRDAFARVSAAAAVLDRVRQLDVLPRGLRPRARAPHAWLAPVTGLAAAAAAALLFVFGPFAAPRASYATEVAEIETVTLADGSQVTLGPLSRIDVRFTQDVRRVQLVSGEAFFDVTHDARRRFAVEAGDANVVVRGTQFDVRRRDGIVRVAVARGAVEVDASAPLGLNQTASALLRAGDQAVAPERVRLLAPARELELSQVAPEEAGAWRLGHLSYIEAPLADLVADLNRYYAPGIRLSDPELGAFRLTASFRVEDIDTFLSTLPDAAPVRLTRGPRDEVVISPAR